LDRKKQPRLAAFINAVVLLTSAGFLGYGAFVRLFNPEVVSSGNIVWVAALGIIINGVSAFLFFPQRHAPISKAGYVHFLIDALVSLVVIITGIVISYTHLYWLDPVISLSIMLAIIFCNWRLLKDSLKIIIDAVRSGRELDEIKKVITSVRHI
jgi:cobalt-zinc-cadmium efflux system protein